MACASAAQLLGILVPARAQEVSHYEVSGGGEVVGHTWSAYTSTTYALSKWGLGTGGIRDDGWRLRAGGGYWQYERRQEVWLPRIGAERVTRRRTGSFAELLLGYQATVGDVTLKGFAGGLYERQQWSAEPVDADQASTAVAAKLLVESWFNITPDAFAQLDVGWVSEDNALNARVRAGYRVTPWLSIGPELGYWAADRADVRGRDDITRFGGFARYEWSTGEVSISAGLSDDDRRFYATVNALLRF